MKLPADLMRTMAAGGGGGVMGEPVGKGLLQAAKSGVNAE